MKNILSIISFGIVLASTANAECALNDNDSKAVRNVIDEYVNGWLAGDASRVMATLTEDAVLMPHHGDPVREGTDAISAFWFPDGEITAPVTAYELTVNEISGCDELAIVRGRLVNLTFEFQGKTYTQDTGNYLSVLRKGDDDQWRMSHRIWNDPVIQQN